MSKDQDDFKHALHNTHEPISDWMRQYYLNCFPLNRNELIKMYRETIDSTVNHSIEQCLNDDNGFDVMNLNATRAKVEDLINEICYLDNMYVIMEYYRNLEDQYKSDYVERMYLKFSTLFQLGTPRSLPFMALFLNGQLCSDILNFNSCYTKDYRIFWLHRLSELGVETAQHILTEFYLNYESTEWMKKTRRTLNCSIDERYEGLRKLFLLGNKNAQNEYAMSLFYESTLHGKSIKTRFHELIQKEKKFCQYVTLYYARNGTQYHNDGFTLQFRLSILEKRAVEGDNIAHDELITAYLKNILHKTALNINEGERWMKLLNLREINPFQWNRSMRTVYIKECYPGVKNLMDIPLSKEERFEYIFNQAMDNGSTSSMAETLLDVGNESVLNLPVKEKFEILYKITNQPTQCNGIGLANCLLYNGYYTYELPPTCKVEKLNLSTEARIDMLTELIKKNFWLIHGMIRDLIQNVLPNVSKELKKEIKELRKAVDIKQLGALVLLHCKNPNIYNPIIQQLFHHKQFFLMQLMSMKEY